MSKRNRSRSRNLKGKRRKQKPAAGTSGLRKPTRRMIERLDEAHELIDRGHLVEARDLLECEDRRRRGYPALLEALLYVYQRQDDHVALAKTAERLVRLVPRNDDAWLMMAQGYLFSGRAPLGLNAYRHFLERWPDHKYASKARKAIEVAEDEVANMLREFNLTESEFDLLVLHDEILFAIAAGELEDAIDKARELLKVKPGIVSARNNLALALFHVGRVQEALSACRETHQDFPENQFAEALLGRILFLSGVHDEAAAIASEIVNTPADSQDPIAAQVELLSLLGRDDDVLRLVEHAESIANKDPQCCAVLHHHKAVAQMRSGNEREARRSWKRCLRESPGFPLAHENLAELDAGSDCHAPWAEPLGKWVPREVAERFIQSARNGTGGRSESDSLKHAIRAVPQLRSLVPALLDRGDRAGRELALLLARGDGSPEMLDALEEFATSNRGPDAMRQEAMMFLKENGRLRDGPCRVYLNGEWREIELFHAEITDEPSTSINPLTQDLQTQGFLAIRDDDAERAEQIFRECLEIDPDDPTSQHNLAAAIMQQGGPDARSRAESMFHEIRERFPDYLFARTSLAQLAIQDGDLTTARDLIKPLAKREKLHHSEAMAYLTVSLELALAADNPDGAERVLEMMEQIDSEDPRIQQLRRRIDRARLLGDSTIGRLLERLQG